MSKYETLSTFETAHKVPSSSAVGFGQLSKSIVAIILSFASNDHFTLREHLTVWPRVCRAWNIAARLHASWPPRVRLHASWPPRLRCKHVAPPNLALLVKRWNCRPTRVLAEIVSMTERDEPQRLLPLAPYAKQLSIAFRGFERATDADPSQTREFDRPGLLDNSWRSLTELGFASLREKDNRVRLSSSIVLDAMRIPSLRVLAIGRCNMLRGRDIALLACREPALHVRIESVRKSRIARVGAILCEIGELSWPSVAHLTLLASPEACPRFKGFLTLHTSYGSSVYVTELLLRMGWHAEEVTLDLDWKFICPNGGRKYTRSPLDARRVLHSLALLPLVPRLRRVGALFTANALKDEATASDIVRRCCALVESNLAVTLLLDITAAQCLKQGLFRAHTAALRFAGVRVIFLGTRTTAFTRLQEWASQYKSG